MSRYYQGILNLICTLLFLLVAGGSTPESPLPPVKTWKSRDLGHPAQTWVLEQGPSGLIHAGIAGGILTYDGFRWNFTPVPDNRTVRSLVLGPEGNLYWGTNNNYGVILPDPKTGIPTFFSRSASLDSSRIPFGTVWRMATTTQAVGVKLNRRIDLVFPDTIRSIPIRKSVDYLGSDGRRLIGSMDQTGFFTIADSVIRIIPGTQLLAADYVDYLEPVTDSTWFFVARSAGIGTIHVGTGKTTYWKDTRSTDYQNLAVNGATRLPDGSLLVSSLGGGILEFASDGRLVTRYRQQEGLASDNIKRVLVTPEGNFWAGTETGISLVERSSPFRYIDERMGVDQLVLSAHRFQNQLYLGSGNGLYRFDSQSNSFKIPGGFQYQVFDLVTINNRLIGATGAGIIDFSDRNTVLASLRSRCVYQSESTPDLVLAGTIQGVYAFRMKGRQLVPHFRIPRFNFDTNQILEWEGRLWFSTFSDGVFSYPLIGDRPDSTIRVQKTGTSSGFKTGPNQLLISGGALYVNNIEGVFQINADGIPVPVSMQLPTGWKIHGNISSDEAGRWFCLATDEKHRVRMLAGTPAGGWFFKSPEGLSSRRYDFTWIEADGMWWAGGEDGLVRFDPDDLRFPDQPGKTGYSFAIANDSDTLWTGLWTRNQNLNLVLPDHLNRLILQPMSSVFFAEAQPTIQYRMEPNQPEWSGFEQLSSIRLSGIDPGTYTLAVQSRTPAGQTDAPILMKFTIATPVYLSWFAWLLYVSIGLSLIGLAIQWQINRFRRKQAELERLIATKSGQLAVNEKLAAIGQLSAGLAHELNNALTIIQSNIDLSELALRPAKSGKLAELSTEEMQDFQTAVGGIRLGADRIERIVRSMQRASNPHQSEAIPTSIPDMVALVTDFSRPLYPGVSITNTVSSEIPVIVLNPAAVNLALYNLVLNAIEAVRRKQKRQPVGYQPDVTITVRLVSAKNSVEIRIDDNGDGIPEAIRNRVFDPFFTTKTVGDGTGMGLNESWELIRSVGGTLTLSENPSAGCRAIISLPVR